MKYVAIVILLSLTSGQFFFLLLDKFNCICKQRVHVTITSTHHFLNYFQTIGLDFVMKKLVIYFVSHLATLFIKDSSYLAKVLLQTIWILGILKRDTKFAV